MNKFLKYLVIICSVAAGLFIVCLVVMSIMISAAFGSFDKSYSVSELKEEYYSNKKEIQELIIYYNTIKPQNYIVEIEFKNNQLLTRLTILERNSSNVVYQKWDVHVDEIQSHELTKYLGWNTDDVKNLKEKLDKANCISLEEGEPMKIGFKRSGLGMFSFNIFQDKTTDRNDYNDGCKYILIDRYLCLEYGGGAVGNQCFPK